ncbi:MAG TPA: hypothetical protein VJA18_01325 [Candidatus Nanoarchaeia archaeon]|nr:hypothetical protein [Candidatus Nanoarchaeia archaeon]
MNIKESFKKTVLPATATLVVGLGLGYGFRADYGNAWEEANMAEALYGREKAIKYAKGEIQALDNNPVSRLEFARRWGLELYLENPGKGLDWYRTIKFDKIQNPEN